MRWLRILLTAFLIVIMESAFLPALSVQGVRPDLAFIYILFLAFFGPREDSFIACWFVGLMKDLLSVGTPGAYALLYSACGYEVNALTQRLFKENILVQLALALPAAFLVHALYLAGTFFNYPHVAWGGGLRSALLCAVYTTLMLPPLMLLMGRFKVFLGIRPRPALPPQEKPETEDWPCL